MQYLLMVYESEQWPQMSKAEKNRIHDECTVWHERLVKSGHSRGAFGLRPPSTATTVSGKNGQAVITDGPFAETREVLGGFEIVECAHRDEALAIARTFPALRIGFAMEVRPTRSDCREE